MRTAATLVVLTGGTRVRSRAALGQAADSLADVTSSEPCGPIRFTGYIDQAFQPYELPVGARIARYEADYLDA